MVRFCSTLILLVALGVPAASAKYLPPRLYELVGDADLVVVGTIVEVQEKNFVLQVDEVLTGSTDEPAVVVRKFVDWTCAVRPKPYAVGQKEVAFLVRPDSRTPSEGEAFVLMSAGSEAEWEIVGDYVYATLLPIDGYELVAGHPGPELPLAVVRNAVRRYRSCFAVKGWPGVHRSIEQVCDEEKLRAFREGSLFHRYLVMLSLEAIEQRKASGKTKL